MKKPMPTHTSTPTH